MWSPLGSRPHLLLTADQALADYAASVNSRARAWWAAHGDGRAWDDVVQELPSHYLHITLAWLDRPTNQVSPDEWNRVRAEAARRLAAVPLVEVRIGEPIVGPYALEVYVHPSAELDEVAAQARAALRAVFGERAAPEPPADKPYRPHLSCFYGTAAFDDAGLQEALLDGTSRGDDEHSTVLTMPAQAILTDQDTFHPGGFRWDATSAVRMPVGG